MKEPADGLVRRAEWGNTCRGDCSGPVVPPSAVGSGFIPGIRIWPDGDQFPTLFHPASLAKRPCLSLVLSICSFSAMAGQT